MPGAAPRGGADAADGAAGEGGATGAAAAKGQERRAAARLRRSVGGFYKVFIGFQGVITMGEDQWMVMVVKRTDHCEWWLSDGEGGDG